MNRAAVILYPGCLLASATLPLEMLVAANAGLRSRRRRRQVDLVALHVRGQRRPGVGNFGLVPTRALHRAARPDLLVVPSMWGNPARALTGYPEITATLAAWAGEGTVIVGAGTGAFFVAEAGLLENRSATTHWSHFDRFAGRYPGVRLRRDYFIVEADSFFTLGSINALADLMVYLIGRDLDFEQARMVAQHFSPEVRRPFEELCFSDRRTARLADETVVLVQEYLAGALAGEVNMVRVAARFGISQRSLNRRFKASTGLTPGRYLAAMRISTARELLQHTNLSPTEISERVGYTESNYFHQVFRRATGLTPGSYRQMMRAKLFSAPEGSARE